MAYTSLVIHKRELLSLQRAVLLQPPVRFDDLLGIRGGCEDLGNQAMRRQRDRSHELLQLIGSELRRLNGRFRGRSILRIGDSLHACPPRHGGRRDSGAGKKYDQQEGEGERLLISVHL